MARIKRKFFLLLLLATSLVLRCATDPGTSTPVSGSAIVFTYASGDVRVLTNVEGTRITAAAVLFEDGIQATAIEDGVSVTWPKEVSFELPDCDSEPTLVSSTTQTLSKIFLYAYPTDCAPPTESIAGQVTLVITNASGSSRTLNDTTSPVTEQIFTSSGTWTAPPGVTSVTVECWGGGGGGGSYSVGMGGNGGGGGAYSKANSVSVTPGVTYTVTVGNGGAGGDTALGSTIGSDGGDSWFSTTGTVLAKGGTGANYGAGVNGTGGASASSVGDAKFSGGNGGTTPNATGAGGGSSAGSSTNGNNGAAAGGSGGVGGAAPSGGGAGGNGAQNPLIVGDAGLLPGGGGGGSGNGAAGGSGASGKIILDWN